MVREIPNRKIAAWLVCLSVVAVGLKNFEPGLSIDGPAYATVARNIARSGEWFRLHANVPDYQPYFADHPHLALWAVAGVFKVLPAEDWAARIPGHLFYLGFLCLFFAWVKRKSSQATAVLATLLLWSFYQFANTFSSVYLDPACAFFGLLSLYLFDTALGRRRLDVGVLAGVALAFSLMSKGMSAVAFGPCLLFLYLSSKDLKGGFKICLVALCGFFLPLVLYYLAVRASNAPDYFQIYWDHQFTNRVGKKWSLVNLFGKHYWIAVVRYTYWLALVGAVALRHLKKLEGIRYPAILAITGILLYAPANFNGGQYLVYLLPWIAWLAAGEILTWFNARPAFEERFINGSMALCLFVIILVNYLPIRIHKQPISSDMLALNPYTKANGIKTAVIPKPHIWDPFTVGCHIAWHMDIEVKYWESKMVDVPVARDVVLFYHPEDPKEREVLRKRGWCQIHTPNPYRAWEMCRISSSNP